MKKKLLFVIDSLDCAGAEKSLVTLLSLLDYSRYSVDLMLFAHGGALEELVPEQVNILPPLSYTSFTKESIGGAFLNSVRNLDYKMFLARMKYSIKISRKNYLNSQKAKMYWQSVSEVIEENTKSYDVAISYAQGIPTFYVAEKVRAKKKLAWVNVSYRLDEKNKKFQRQFYKKIDKIVAVSHSTKEIFNETFPENFKKTDIIYDINHPKLIADMAEMGNSYEDNFKGLKILTIGRLDYQKGYDLALEACKKLKKKGVNFKWYVLGKGSLQKEIEGFIKEFNLEENFILLGVKSNPYPYIKNADIYVQTSKFEGFGLAIAEARMLNIPIVTTKFDAVYSQMIQEKNGLVVDMDADAIYKGIMRLINDKKLRNSIIQYLSKEKKGNLEELHKFYQIINESEQTYEKKSIIHGY